MNSEKKEEIYRVFNIPKDKESFKFTYTLPSLDWYEDFHVEIKPDDYYYFELNRRFGPSWWLIGTYPTENHDWVTKEIGQLDNHDLTRFIKWVKTDRGSRITKVTAISGSFDILEEIYKVMKVIEDGNNSK